MGDDTDFDVYGSGKRTDLLPSSLFSGMSVDLAFTRSRPVPDAQRGILLSVALLARLTSRGALETMRL